jgi:peptide-methionine (R)-S-oxide reductase
MLIEQYINNVRYFMVKQIKVTILIMFMFLVSCAQNNKNKTPQTAKIEKKQIMDSSNNPDDTSSYKILTDEEYKKVLSPAVYNVAREKGTERPWTSIYEKFSETGTFYCAVCGNGLFVSDTKFESGCGWPSFYQPLTKESVIYEEDNTHGMARTEVMCGRCKSHLGHVFNDAPKTPTGLRYCINGVVLDFKKAQAAEKQYLQEKPTNK